MTKPAQERCGVCNWPIVDNGTRIEHVDFDHPAEPAATVHGTGSGEALCKGPVDSDGYHCICSNYHEHNGECRYHNQVFHNVLTPPASQLTVTQLHGLLESLATHYRGYLPHEDAPGFSSDTRTRMAFIEDTLRKADALLRAPAQSTVTLSQDELATYIALRLPEHLPLRGDRAEAKRVLLALLRAAERHQP